jgi:hypothetical protein
MPVVKMSEDLRLRCLAILRKKNRKIGNLGKQSSVFPQIAKFSNIPQRFFAGMI